ncbi:MAG: CCA tRNA nucleotidyltransferase [Lachnospiraceae bacterium]|nr:CCA tRNA nucleotidyltransferase [Lachnospiraceae bacterium]
MSKKITLPQAVSTILETLQQAGFEAYAVGGCVRDVLMGRTPADWDITTSARPQQVKALFRRTIDTGIQHGTVTVMVGDDGFEVTTYRIDGEYLDGRHPEEVTFTASLSEDLKRRDFTINAMAYNDESGLVDLFGGQEDLAAGMIRCVGTARERFREDALRMMRAVRFSAQFGYEIEAETLDAMKELAPNLAKVSAERIQTELLKLAVSAHPEMLRVAYESGLTAVFFPEFNVAMETPQHSPHHCYSVGEHTLHAMMQIRADKVLRLAMLFHDIAKPVCKSTDAQGIDHFKGHPAKGAEMTRQILRRLKFDNDTIAKTCRLVQYHDWEIHAEETPRALRRAVARIGEQYFPEMFEVNRADILAQHPEGQAQKLAKIAALETIYRDVTAKKQCLSLKDLAVKGSDLIAAGLTPGKGLGDVLQRMLEDVIEEPSHNEAAYLLSHVKDFQEG